MSSKKLREAKYQFIVDEDLGKTYANILALDKRFVVHRFFDHFKPGTPDQVWIPDLAKKGWKAITHDGKIRLRHRDVVVRSRARIIVSVGGSDFQGQTQIFFCKLAKAGEMGNTLFMFAGAVRERPWCACAWKRVCLERK